MGFNCKICGHTSHSLIYQGPIRAGKFGNLSQESHSVFRCQRCHAACLDTVVSSVADSSSQEKFYESDDYRKSVDSHESPVAFYLLHDAEQIQSLPFLHWQKFRGSTVADIGCGAGSFLDFVSGLAGKCIAVEPSQTFQHELSKKGYSVFSYAHLAQSEWQEACDWITTFSVLEHVENPKQFLLDSIQLLKPGGKVLLSTPNTKDLLLSFLGSEFEKFYYRQAHLWYFDEASLRYLFESIGLTEIKIFHHQRFGMGNFLGWARDRRPQGDLPFPFTSPALDSVWKAELQRLGVSDYLYVTAQKSDKQRSAGRLGSA